MQTIIRHVFPNSPVPLGTYAHAVSCGDLIFVCGMGSRNAQAKQVPGLKLDESGRRLAYDIVAEARQCLMNLKEIVESAGSSLRNVVDITVFLVDMRDFEKVNSVFREFFENDPPARTTLGISSLPGNISIEVKAIAVRGKE